MIVTVAIINHNYGRFLQQAISSVLAQQTQDVELELLIIDDGSIDDSLEVAGRFASDGRVRVSHVMHNIGFGGSIGRAVQEARGEWIMFLDADDWFANDKVSKICALMSPEKHYIANSNVFVSESGQRSGHEGSPCNTSTITIRRSIAMDLLPVDDESGFHVLQIVGLGLIIDAPLTFHRIHNTSMASDPAAEYASRSVRYSNVVVKLEGWMGGRPEWLTLDGLRKAIREFRSMSRFASIEVEIHKKRRWRAVRIALSRIFASYANRESLRTFLRACLLRPIPSRERIFLT